MATITTDLTGVDLADYGVEGELPRLLARVVELRGRERAAWAERDAARTDATTIGRRMADAEAQALRDDTEPPDTATMRRETGEALEVAQARLEATTLVLAEAERLAVRYLREVGHDDRAKVAEVVTERHAAAVAALDRALELVDELLEATGVLAAMTPAPDGQKLPTIAPPARTPLHRALREVAAQVLAVAPARLAAADDDATEDETA